MEEITAQVEGAIVSPLVVVDPLTYRITPKPIRITFDDAIKVARKAELFQDLFLNKVISGR